MPRCCSIFIQSEVVNFLLALARTWPASRITLPYHRNFSVMVVLPASGWLTMAKVRRFRISSVMGFRNSRVKGVKLATRDRRCLFKLRERDARARNMGRHRKGVQHGRIGFGTA